MPHPNSARAQLSNRLLNAAGFLILLLFALIPLRWEILLGTTLYHFHSLQTALIADNANLSVTARALTQDIRAWRAEITPFIQITPSLAWLPRVGGDFAQLPQFAVLLDRTLDASEPTWAIYDSLYQTLSQGASPGVALLELSQKKNQLESARTALNIARAQSAIINPRALSPQVSQLLANTNRLLSEWDASLRLLERAPTLLGSDTPRRYLILAQNNDEIRPTGGFISAVGVLRLERGEISVEWFGDSFAADDLQLVHSPPPLPLQKYMSASQWLLRDSNWYADFPTSAEVAQSMYAHDHHVQTDGVIAVDTRFMPRLVDAVGGMELAGKPLDRGSVISLLKENWKPLPPGDMSEAWFASDRKNFLSELFNALLLRVETGTVHSFALVQALWHGLREKSVQMYFNDAEAEQALLNANWGGAVNAGADDFLFVVDANVGFNKVNARVTRAITYNVNMNSNTASVEITYNNPSVATNDACDLLKQHKDNTYASMEQSCYWNYVRVLAPSGSRFLSAQGVTDAGDADDVGTVTAFGGYAIIPRASTRTVRFDYTLPRGIIHADTYSLTLQQQAGLAATPVTIRIELPRNIQFQSATHNYTWRDANTIEIHETLDHDMTITLYFNAP